MHDQSFIRTFCCGPVMPAEISVPQLGGKAAHLIRVAEAGLPVPPGLVISTGACREYFARNGRLLDDFWSQLSHHIRHIEVATGLRLGARRQPLLVSVRSGAPVSMPGMLDTILNVGICDQTVSSLIRLSGNPRFVWDSYRRLVQSYAETVYRVPADPFEQLLRDELQRESADSARELDFRVLRHLTQLFLRLYQDCVGEPFPQDPWRQLVAAIEAVFRSWRNSRAVEYRRLHQIDDHLGTAVIVQAMVFGNLGSTSGSGVAFTRNPSVGNNELYLDFLWNAQGEDVVSGRRTVQDDISLSERLPGVAARLGEVGRELESLFGDAQDFEFTVQEGELFLLQTRTAQRTPWAALRMACEMVEEGLINVELALQRLAAYDLATLQMVRLATDDGRPPVSAGVPASPGVAVGQITLQSEHAVALARAGGHPILVRHDFSTDDLPGLAAAAGILTAQGGRTSHAAVIARQLNKVCIVGCRDLVIGRGGGCRLGNTSFHERDDLSLDGHTGRVYSGRLSVITERPVAYLKQVEQWKRQGDGPAESCAAPRQPEGAVHGHTAT